ncbi:MAG: patatin-like phospholipase family protein [Pleomorphochaeta sp.]
MLIPSKKKKTEPIEERYILSIDGGGMRGIVPAVVISKLNEKLKEFETEKPFYSFFDLITGTSTGGLIALGLSTSPLISNLKKEEGEDFLQTYETPTLSFLEKLKGIKPQNPKSPKLITKGTDCSSLKDFYVNDGKSIFHSESRIFGTLLKDKYDAKHIENFLYKTFQNAKMKQCLVPTMVVSYDAAEGIPFNFKSWENSDFYVREAARATSAAPTYFPPSILYDKEAKKKRYLIDGGIIANNPVLLAYSAARKLYPNCKKFHILSLSTASNDYSMQDIDISGGLMGWIDPSKGAPIQKIASTSQMQLAALVAQNIKDVEFTRIHYNLKGDSFKLDDTSTYAINTLIDSAEQLYRKEEKKLTEFIKNMIKREDFSHILDIDKLKTEPQNETEVLQLENQLDQSITSIDQLANSKTETTLIENTNAKSHFFSKKKKTELPQENINTKELEKVFESDNEELQRQKSSNNEKYQEILDKYGFSEKDLE